MSKKHPIMALARPSGAGSQVVKDAFEHVFFREDISPALIEGESFHRYNRTDMAAALDKALKEGNSHFSHFGPEANLLQDLEELFKSYGKSGSGRRRHYLHNMEDVLACGNPDLKPGDFTPWEDIPEGSDMLFYEGLHGCIVTDGVDVASQVDLKLGLAPVINLEWIQKIHRDINKRGYSEEAVVDTILRRMHDYVHYLIPQFERTDINFQTVPVVDTSDPMIARDVPTLDECVVVVRFKHPEKFEIDFPYLMSKIHGAWMTRRNSMVVPGGKLGLALEVILAPVLRNMMAERDA